jgi:SAM-dependent methyltransferase
MNFWDQRYGEPGFAYGTAPNAFLVEQTARVPAGRVLCLAEGEGRNAVFLATRGYHVHAIDQSPVGLRKATELARNAGVKIATQVGDLGEIKLEAGEWNGIVSIFAHMPAVLRKSLHAKVVAALAPGGVFVLEAYTRRQLEIGGIGGPNEQQLDYFMSIASLREELSGLEFVHAEETFRDIDEGRFHRGRGAVVHVIAAKPR